MWYMWLFFLPLMSYGADTSWKEYGEIINGYAAQLTHPLIKDMTVAQIISAGNPLLRQIAGLAIEKNVDPKVISVLLYHTVNKSDVSASKESIYKEQFLKYFALARGQEMPSKRIKDLIAWAGDDIHIPIIRTYCSNMPYLELALQKPADFWYISQTPKELEHALGRRDIAIRQMVGMVVSCFFCDPNSFPPLVKLYWLKKGADLPSKDSTVAFWKGELHDYAEEMYLKAEKKLTKDREKRKEALQWLQDWQKKEEKMTPLRFLAEYVDELKLKRIEQASEQLGDNLFVQAQQGSLPHMYQLAEYFSNDEANEEHIHFGLYWYAKILTANHCPDASKIFVLEKFDFSFKRKEHVPSLFEKENS